MIQQPPPKGDIKTNFYYRCRPTLYETAVIGPYLADLDGTKLQLFHLKDFSLHQTFEVLDKEDQYSAKIQIINEDVLAIFGTEKFVLVSVVEEKVIGMAKVDGYIEASQIWNNYIVALTTDEDSQSKLISCWKFDAQAKTISKIEKSTAFQPPEFQQCSDENLRLSIIMSVDKNPRIYIYWKSTIHMIEVDPIHQLSERYARNSYVTYVSDLNQTTYAEIVENKIHVHEKKGGKRIAQLFYEEEVFEKIIPSKQSGELFSISNKGVKCWKLQMDKAPTIYTGSQNYKVQKLFVASTGIIGINSETNNIVLWEKSEECQTNLFPNQIIRTILKLNENQVVFLLEATASSEEENEYHVEKYNKLQIYDFEKDSQIAKKAMNQSKYTIESDSIIVCEKETLRFIVKEEDPQTQDCKKYLIRWTPFSKDQNQKDTKKRQIKGAKNFTHLKLYPYNRILGLTVSNHLQQYSLFGKEEQAKTQIVLYDFGPKKFAEYDLQGDIFNAEVTENDSIYAIGMDRVSIYKIDTENKNRLEKINQLQISTLLVKPINNHLLIKKEDCVILFNEDFELLSKIEVEADDKELKVMPTENGNFLLKTDKTLSFWDVKEEDARMLDIVDCPACLTDLLSGKLICADKWLKAYDLNLD